MTIKSIVYAVLKLVNIVLVGVLLILQVRVFLLNGIQFNDGILEPISYPLWQENSLPINLQFVGLVFLIVSIIFTYRLNFRISLILSVIGALIYFIPDLAKFSIRANIYSNESGMNNLEFNFLLDSFIPVSNAILIIVPFVILIQISIFAGQYIETGKDRLEVKRNIIELGTKFTRLQVSEIAERCKVSKGLIVRIANEMIKNNEIYAEYFKSTKSVVFNQQANIDEIDSLMAQYKEWEIKGVEKK